jgi:hypothetical protein
MQAKTAFQELAKVLQLQLFDGLPDGGIRVVTGC